MAREIQYKEIRELRELLLDEMQNEFSVITIEHYQLIEMRIQNILLAGITSKNLKDEKPKWKKDYDDKNKNRD